MMKVMKYLLAPLLLFFVSQAFSSPQKVLNILGKNKTVMFNFGMALVQENPDHLVLIAAANNENDDTIRAMVERAQAIRKDATAVKLKLMNGMIFANEKATGVRVEGFEPATVLSFRGRTWQYNAKETMDANYDSLEKFFGGTRESASLVRAILPRANAEVVNELTPSGWPKSRAFVGALAGGVLGTVAGPKGTLIGGAVGASVGLASAAGYEYKSICRYVKSTEGKKELSEFKNVKLECKPSRSDAAESDISIIFNNGKKQAGFTVSYSRFKTDCCKVDRYDNATTDGFGKITQAEREAIKVAAGTCKGEAPKEVPAETQKAAQAVVDRLVNSSLCTESKEPAKKYPGVFSNGTVR